MKRLIESCRRPGPLHSAPLLIVAIVLGSVAQADAQSGTRPNESAQAPGRVIPDDLSFANQLYRDRRYDLAAEEYLKFLEKGATGADATDARYGLSNAYLFLGKYKEARSSFESFLASSPNHPNAATALYRVGETSYLLGDLPSALRSLEKYTLEHPKHKNIETAWSHLGDIYSRSGALSKARDAYLKVLETATEPLASRSRLGLGRVLQALGKSEDAIAAFSQLSRSGGPEWADKGFFELGKMEMKQERFDKALVAFTAIERGYPRSNLQEESQLLKAECLSRLGRSEESMRTLEPLTRSSTTSTAIQATNTLGLVYISQKRSPEALRLFDDAAKRYSKTPYSATLSFQAAEAALSAGENREAKARFVKFLESFPADPLSESALLRAGSLALSEKSFAEGQQLIAAYTSQFPKSAGSPDLALLKARLLLGEGKSKEAISVLEAAVAKAGSETKILASLRYYLGVAYRSAGQVDRSIEVLAQLAKSEESAVAIEAQFLLGQSLVEGRDFAKAVPALEAYLKAKPKGDVADFALAHLAHAQIELGQRESARHSVNSLRSQFPKSPALPTALLRLGDAELASKATTRAIDLFKAASECNQLDLKVRALSSLGWAKLQANQPLEAAEDFAALLDKFPSHPLAPNAALARGRALELAGKRDLARKAYSEAAELYPAANLVGQALLAQSRLLILDKKPEEASKILEVVAEKHLKSCGEAPDTVLSEWGWALVDSGKPSAADQVFHRLLREYPESPRSSDARFNLAESAYSQREYKAVITLLEPLVRVGAVVSSGILESALFRLGRAQIELKDWKGAETTLTRLAQDFPKSTFRREALFWNAEALLKSGSANKAESLFAQIASEDAPESEPKSLRMASHRRRIQCLVEQQKWADALAAAESYRSSHSSDPEMAEVGYSRGRALQGLARFDEARQAYQEVIDSRKKSDLAALAQFMRGECYFHQKSYRDALREFLKVDYLYESSEWQSSALMEAGKVYEQLSQWTEAAETYERLRSKFPTSELAKKAEERLVMVRKRLTSVSDPQNSESTGR